VTALVECSTVGVGRNLAVLRYLAEITPIHIIAPTGVYRHAYIPFSLLELGVDELARRWVQEITEGIDGTSLRTGFIKLAVSDEGVTPLEERNLRAAAKASRESGAVVASHTPNGELFQQQMNILEEEGHDPGRFIWVHANLEPDLTRHLEAARRGVYVEFDAIGAEWQSQETLADYTIALLDADCGEQILLSHDAGWYDPAQPDGKPAGEGIRGYVELIETFIPMLRGRGISNELIHQMTVSNPARAFALSGSAA